MFAFRGHIQKQISPKYRRHVNVPLFFKLVRYACLHKGLLFVQIAGRDRKRFHYWAYVSRLQFVLEPTLETAASHVA